MEAWAWGLVFKPLIAVALFVALFGGAKLIAWAIYHLMPKSRLRAYLFKTSVSDSDPAPPRILPARKSDR